MIRRWWKRYLYGVGAGHHVERCPFCGQTFDIRDLGQVLVHFNHQLAAGAPPAIDLDSRRRQAALAVQRRAVPTPPRRLGGGSVRERRTFGQATDHRRAGAANPQADL